jgi:two-component system, OmpR family, alkaline phosphatase synthesis response regulator PhoP
MVKNVLVVDDEPGIVKMVESRLKAAGYGVLTATGGEEALRVCRQTKPDVAVLDVMMPGLPGDHVAQAMREDPALRDIPVIFLTALVRKQGAPLDDAYLRGPVAGFYYLAKPFKGSELLDMLGKVLGQA